MQSKTPTLIRVFAVGISVERENIINCSGQKSPQGIQGSIVATVKLVQLNEKIAEN